MGDNERSPEQLFPRGDGAETSAAHGALALGALLRRARERQHLPLAAIARTLRIPEKTLHALEDGAHDTLPAAVYTRGFVRAYAEYLGLDAGEAVRAFTAERSRVPGGPNPPLVRLAPRPVVRVPRRFPRPRTAAGALAGVLALIAVLYLLVLVVGFARPPALVVTDPPADTELAGSTIVVRGKTDPTAAVHVNGERTFVESDGTFEEPLSLSPGVHTIRVSAKSVGGREQTVTRDVLVRAGEDTPPAPPAATETPAPRPSPQPTEVVRLGVEADGVPVWLELTVDGHVVFSGLLAPGARQEVTGREVRVTSGRGERTILFLDGKDAGRLARTPGVIRGVVFTRSGASGTVERRTP